MKEGRRTSVRSTVVVTQLVALIAVVVAIAAPQTAAAQVVAYDMVGSSSLNLTDHTNIWEGAFSSSADGFQKYQRGVSSTIPFAMLDDSLVIFPGDTSGIIKDGNTDVFFGAADTINGENPSGSIEATWTFDITGATDLVLSIDMGAMGDFETSDTFTWSYSIDGGPSMTAFANSVDDSISHTYTLEDGDSFTLNDPMLMQGTILTNDLATFNAALTGSGSTLVLTLEAETNGSGEAFVFQNIVISEGGLPIDVWAFDMVESSSQRLNSFTNPWDGAFGSLGDGFQKYQRFVSSSIPFDIVDDSLSIFPADSHGIIKEGNTDIFFGVNDTINGDNSGVVTATWVFDISGATGLGLSIDAGAMGDYESSDFFEWTYSVDGGPTLSAFSSSVDEAGSNTYVLEGGGSFTLNDPMLLQGTILTNDLASFDTLLFGTGSELTLELSVVVNAGRESLAFQNLVITQGNPAPPEPPELEIHEIQGSGSASVFAGSVVTSRDNAVTVVASNGFFMQTPTSRSDFDVDTSDGIFVFTGGAPGVAVGDRVDVTGQIQEFFGFTEFSSSPSVTVIGTGSVPAATVFDDLVPSPDPTAPSCAIEFECYEGMLVDIAIGTVSGPNQRFGSDPIAEVHIVAGTPRAFREPGVIYPGLGMPPIPTWDGNPEVFELDPDKLGLPNQIIPAGSTFSGTGVLGFEFGGYEFWPSSLTVNAATLPDAVRARNPGEFTVGTLNLFRLFDDVNDPESIAADGRTRDDFVVSTAEYARRLTKFAVHIVDVLDAPDILAVQEVESLKVMEDLAFAIETYDSSVTYSAYLEEGNDLGTIDIGFLTRERIQVDAITQLGKDEFYTNPLNGELEILHDRPPLLLEGYCLLDYGAFPIAVMTVHNRSLGGIEGSEAERVRQKRYAQAVYVAEQAQDLQTTDPDIRLVLTGDFNAFEFTDGYADVMGIVRGDYDPAESLVCGEFGNFCDDFVEPDLTDHVLGLDPLDRYSFVFRGSAQALDHALTTEGLADEMTGADFGRGNADAAVDLINQDTPDAVLPLRSSDHDGLVVYILKDEDNDGVPNDDDICPGTVIPESVPTRRLGVNRFALVDGDGVFDTTDPEGEGPGKSFTVGDTAGCSCEQIIANLALGNGHTEFGCSISAMEDWVGIVTP